MNQQVFNEIYEKNIWKNGSGLGSNPKYCKPWIEKVNSLLELEGINTVLDLGCGDWQTGQVLNLDGKDYTGVDVSDVVLSWNKRFESDNIKFICDDLSTMEFPEVDLIIIKDVLAHLPNEQVKIIMDKIMKSAKYALICSDAASWANIDLDTPSGGHRGLNLTLAPWNYDLDIVSKFSSVGQYKVVYLYQKDRL